MFFSDSEAESHMFWAFGSKITVFAVFVCQCLEKTLVFTQFSPCCKVQFLYAKKIKTVFYNVFASRAQQTIVRKLLKNIKNGTQFFSRPRTPKT